jgi:peroxiredoxin
MSLNSDIQHFVAKARDGAPAAVFAGLGAMIARLGLDGVGATAPKPGERSPAVSFRAVNGELTPLSSLYRERPLVLLFYRGRWCPFCDLTLKAFERAAPQFTAAGASLAAVSPQVLAETVATAAERGLSYPLFSDPGNAAARAFGLDWQVHQGAEMALYKGFGSNVDQANGDDEWRLPAPAAFVIDQTGTVRWAWVESDWTRRPEPDEVLAAVHALGEAT